MPADRDFALQAMAPGPLLRIGSGRLVVDVAPQAGGRIAQIAFDGIEWLSSHREDNAAMIGWGSYPMLPWAGRVRHGKFEFDGIDHQLPLGLGEHAIHGVGYALPWQVDLHNDTRIELSLQLPQDERWPFGGVAKQVIDVRGDALHLDLSVTAGDAPMPQPVVGWHPWFLKPERLHFAPRGMYPRDADGMAVLPLGAATPGPWDDCFINHDAVRLERGAQALQMASGCEHWVVYDMPEATTCVEPQSGPPDAFNLLPSLRLEPGQTHSAWFTLGWSNA